MNIRNRVRPLAFSALAALALIGTSAPVAVHAKPKIDPNIELNCLLDGDWYDAGTELDVTYTDEEGGTHHMTIICNGYDGHWHSVRIAPGGVSTFINPALLGNLQKRPL